MKALGLARISKQKSARNQIWSVTIWMENIHECFSMLFFCKYVILLVSISIVVKTFMLGQKHARFFHVCNSYVRKIKVWFSWKLPRHNIMGRLRACSEPILLSNDLFTFKCQKCRLIIMYPTGTLEINKIYRHRYK